MKSVNYYSLPPFPTEYAVKQLFELVEKLNPSLSFMDAQRIFDVVAVLMTRESATSRILKVIDTAESVGNFPDDMLLEPLEDFKEYVLSSRLELAAATGPVN